MSVSAANLSNLENWFNAHNSKAIIAFSGGVDSSLVLFLARKYLGKDNTLAVISSSPSLKRRDLRIATDFCEMFDINLSVIETQEMSDPNYYSNPADRCYFCKFNLYDELKKISVKYPGTAILNGQNKDDLSDYRPGLKAGEEFKVYHPLADCGLSKMDIRDLAKHFNLPNWDKPASPCLSSRIPYGEEITVAKLKLVESAEEILFEYGFNDMRVRSFNNTARIEVPVNKLPDLMKVEEEIKEKIIQLGFERCEVDGEGLVSGKLNRVLL
jgi:uncharacterized protein